MTLANAPREIKRRAWTMRNAELTCLDKEDDARQQREQTDPRFRLLQSEGDGVPKRWPDRITGRASARRRWSWLRRGRCGGVAGCGSEAGAVVPRPRLREHNNPESTRRWEGSDFRSSEGGGMEWKRARWKWKDGEREGRLGTAAERVAAAGGLCSGGCHRRVRAVGLLGRALFGASLPQAVVGSYRAHLRPREAMLCAVYLSAGDIFKILFFSKRLLHYQLFFLMNIGYKVFPPFQIISRIEFFGTSIFLCI